MDFASLFRDTCPLTHPRLRRSPAPRCPAPHHLRPLLRPRARGDCGDPHLRAARRRGAEILTGKIPPRARPRSRRIRDPQTTRSSTRRWRCGFPAPHSETGEDIAELQLHGGRAVIAAMLDALGAHRGPAPGRGRRIHPARLRERQARSHRGRGPRRPGDGGDARPAAAGVPPDEGPARRAAPKPGGSG